MGKHQQGYRLYKFQVDERVEAENIVIAKGLFKVKELSYDKVTIKIYSHNE